MNPSNQSSQFSLHRELEELRLENSRLLKLLELRKDEAKAPHLEQGALATIAPGSVSMASSPTAKIQLFQSLFRSRTDAYAIRWENKRDGRSGWMPAVAGGWQKGQNRSNVNYLPLTPAVIASHLLGEHHIGFYPLTEKDTCWWVAADFDKTAAMLDALAYLKAARSRGIPAALEISQSGRGAHVWIFFTEEIPASLARQLATGLIHEAISLRGSMNLDSYDRLFPSQDTHSGQGLGNLIAAPLSGKRRHHGTTLFLDTTTLEPYQDQWAYLSSLDRLTPNAVQKYTRELPSIRFGRSVNRLELPSSSKIVPRPALIVRARFDSRITLTASDLGPAMISSVKHAASMPNPEFYERQRQRRSTWNVPRFIRSYDETLEGDLILPRGVLPLLTQLVESSGSTLKIDDQRQRGTTEQFTFTATLRPAQQQAMNELKEVEQGILVALPGAGKTVMACELIAHRQLSTLILVDRKALADQWRTEIKSLLGVSCGQLGGGRSKITGKIDIMLLPTLARRSNIAELSAGYGQVIVDECHHVPAAAFTDAMNLIPARYWLGLTATPYRRDKLDELMYHQLGPVAHTMTRVDPDKLPQSHDELATPQLRLELHQTAFKYEGDADPQEPGGLAKIYHALIADQGRLDQIVADVLNAYEKGGKILVLTTWVSHLKLLLERFRDAGIEPIVFSGKMKTKERQASMSALAESKDQDPLLVIGTGSYIGEGFDAPMLDTLFLAAPISFKGRLVQYVGRITRAYPGKAEAIVHDYHDALTPVLASSLNKRTPGYLSLGFPSPRNSSSTR